MAEEEDKTQFTIDRDWIWFVAGGLATLVALYLIKNILEPQHHHHNYHHHYPPQPRPIPIAKEIEKGYIVDYEGKFSR